MIEEYTLAVTTTGSAGAATGNATSSGMPHGYLVKVEIDTGMPATADWTFSFPTISKTLFTLTNFQNGPLVPGIPVRDTAGALVSGPVGLHPINREVNVAIAQGDAATVNIRFYIQRVN